MPLYCMKCRECDYEEDMLMSYADIDFRMECPNCGDFSFEISLEGVGDCRVEGYCYENSER